MRLATPRAVIDINRLPGLDDIRVDPEGARRRRPRAAGGARALPAGARARAAARPRRCRTSGTPRSGRAAPSAAASRSPIRPPSCRRARWRSTPRSVEVTGRRAAAGDRGGRFLPRHLHDRARARRGGHRAAGAARRARLALRVRRAGAPPRRLRARRPRRAGARRAAAIREARLVFFGVGTRPVRARDAEAALPRPGRGRRRRSPRPGGRCDRDLDPPGDIHGSPALRRHLARRAARPRGDPPAGGSIREHRPDRQRRARSRGRSSRARAWSTSCGTISG